MMQANHQRNSAYIVKAWPRLSETFILNEIISLEQRGLRLRLFSVREPDSGPSHSKVSQVRAKAALAAAIDNLLASLELRQRRAWAARAKIESVFSISASAARLLALFGELERTPVDLGAEVQVGRVAPFIEGK